MAVCHACGGVGEVYVNGKWQPCVVCRGKGEE